MRLFRWFAAAAVLCLPACAEDPPEVAPSPSAVASAPTSPSASPTSLPAPSRQELVLAVRRANGSLETYGLDPASRVASRRRVLAPPEAGAGVVDVTMARGPSGPLCAAWHTGPVDLYEDRESVITCYGPVGAEGQRVAGAKSPQEVAISADGRLLAWAEVSTGGNQAISTAALAEGKVTSVRRFVARAGQPEQGDAAFTGTNVQDLAWIGTTHLAISTVVESDDGPALLRFDVNKPGRRGWLDQGVRVPVRQPDYRTFESAVSAEATSALAVQRASWMDEGPTPPPRAVRVELATGRLLEVLATAAPGREMASVSGSRAAVVYATSPVRSDEVTAYLRLPGDTRGTPIRGLPADATYVLAQP